MTDPNATAQITTLATACATANTSVKVNLMAMCHETMADFFLNLGEKKFRATQVFKWIHKYHKDDFSSMTDLSLKLRDRLNELCEIKAPAIALEQISSDGTIKWLIRLDDGNNIETVFIPEEGRGTLCVSSQVGCSLNCSFCSTAKQGFNRNLNTAEIIGQVWLAARRLAELKESSENTPEITNVVMMGMGEPLLNFDAVVPALSIMRHELAYKLARRKVTVSTAGLVPNIDKLSETSDVALAISLHAPNDTLRDELVPLNKKYPIQTLMEACRRFVGADHRRHVLIEYVMLQGVNDTANHAKQLAKILEGLACKVNLIPFNPYPGSQYLRSKTSDIQQFRNILICAGYIATIRKTRGEDIDAACGQLAGQFVDRTTRSEKWKKLRLSVQEPIKEDGTWIEKLA